MSDEPEAGRGPTSKGPAEAEAGVADQAQQAEAPTASLAEVLEAPPEGSVAEAYHRRARLAEDRLAEVLAAYRKLKTENESHKTRVTKNIERRFEQRLDKLLVSFIDTLDNFDRALEATEHTYAGNPLIDGLILVRTQLLQTLQEHGLERIPALGRPFDPAVSEAVQTQQVSDPDHHHLVVREMLRGYRIHARVVRPSRVVVGEFPGAALTPGPPVDQAAPAEADGGPAIEARAEPTAETAPEAISDAGEPTLEEIINRAEAQEALFPQAFDDREAEEEEEEK